MTKSTGRKIRIGGASAGYGDGRLAAVNSETQAIDFRRSSQSGRALDVHLRRISVRSGA